MIYSTLSFDAFTMFHYVRGWDWCYFLGIGFTSPNQILFGDDIPNSWVMWNIGTFTNPCIINHNRYRTLSYYPGLDPNQTRSCHTRYVYIYIHYVQIVNSSCWTILYTCYDMIFDMLFLLYRGFLSHVGTSKSSVSTWDFLYKPSILGIPIYENPIYIYVSIYLSIYLSK